MISIDIFFAVFLLSGYLNVVIYGPFGYVYQIIMALVIKICPCNANTKVVNRSNPVKRELSTRKLSPLGFGLSMDKLH
jgi:hypothetical protein